MAEEIVKYHPETPLFYDERLRERNHGMFAGWPNEKVHEYTKKHNIHWKDKVEGSESIKEVEDRVIDFFNDIKKKNYNKVLFVTHGGPIILLAIHLFGRNYFEWNKDHTCIYEIEIMNGKAKLITENCTKHLKK